MKKLMVLLVFVMTTFVASAQKITAISLKEKEIALQDSDVKTLQKEFKTTERNKNTFIDEGCIRFTGKDASGNYDISMVVISSNDITAKHADIVILVNHITNEKRVYGETDSKTYFVVKGAVSQVLNDKSTNRSVASCFDQYKKGMASCPNCISCINKCWTQNKKWKRISCAVTSCGSTCFSCVTNVYNFIKCVFE